MSCKEFVEFVCPLVVVFLLRRSRFIHHSPPAQASSAERQRTNQESAVFPIFNVRVRVIPQPLFALTVALKARRAANHLPPIVWALGEGPAEDLINGPHDLRAR